MFHNSDSISDFIVNIFLGKCTVITDYAMLCSVTYKLKHNIIHVWLHDNAPNVPLLNFRSWKCMQFWVLPVENVIYSTKFF